MSSSEEEIGLATPFQLRIGKKSAALELLWQPASNELSVGRQAELAASASVLLDLVTKNRTGGQFGFASSREGRVSGSIAGATLFDPAKMGANWLCAFRIDRPQSAWWIVAMRNGAVYEDRSYDDESRARDSYVKLLEAPDWETMVAPANWGLADTTEKMLAELVDFKGACKLRPVNRTGQFLAAFIAAVVCVSIIYMGWQRLSIFGLGGRSEVTTVEIPALAPNRPVPWNLAPDILEFVAACVKQMDRLYLYINGWKSQPIVCSHQAGETHVAAKWDRSGGSMHELDEQTEFRIGKSADQGCKGQCASVNVPVELGSNGNRYNEETWTVARLEEVLRERFHRLGPHFNMRLQGARHGTLRGDKDSGQAFSWHEIGITASAAIDEFALLLGEIPAFVPESLVYVPNKNQWLLTAKVYHRLQPTGAAR